ncbi:MAG: endonuclease III [Epsilonproteobacteria bacterium]|nr:endonuclease III [Campylobacterota bacterium]
MCEAKNIDRIVAVLSNELKNWKVPVVTEVACSSNPFWILISTVLSLRTKDAATRDATFRLMKYADTPKQLAELGVPVIQRLIYPVGFYRVKANNIVKICNILHDDYNDLVPDSLTELLRLPGVGRKTANLVITVGYNKPGICVDTHVHQISNRLGIVKTKTPFDTEMALRNCLPKKYWIRFNDLLVAFGQNICKSVSPFCSVCPLGSECPKIGIIKHR